jgi:hypothetical protein
MAITDALELFSKIKRFKMFVKRFFLWHYVMTIGASNAAELAVRNRFAYKEQSPPQAI